MIYKYKLKRHIKISRVITFCVSLLFLISCGIPLSFNFDGKDSYYNFVTSEIDENTYKTTLTFEIDDFFVLNNSPSLCYFYSIYSPEKTGISETTYINQLKSLFKKTYAELPGRQITTNKDDKFVLNEEYSNSKLKLYKFTYNDLEQNPTNYLSSIKNLIYNKKYVADFTLQKNTAGGTSFTLKETNETEDTYFNGTDNIELKRFNNDKFISSAITDEDYDYIFSTDEELQEASDFKVIVFCAMSVEGDFSNIFWTDLHKINIFDL